MPFQIVRQDITRIKVDAVVNAANTDLQMGGGVCGAIFNAAGAAQLQTACNSLAPIKTGEAVATPAFKLDSKLIIHTAGPIYHHWDAEKSKMLLYSCYINSLTLAKSKGCSSIAFPIISSGIYGYPKHEALSIATDAIKTFLEDNDMVVYLAVFDKETFEISSELFGAVESYIDENYARSEHFSRCAHATQMLQFEAATIPKKLVREMTAAISYNSVDDLFDKLDEPFNTALLKLIDLKGKTDAQVYKRANIDRKLFSKIRKGQGYMPSKRTILALAIALELSLNETEDLLKRAGYALSHSNKFDVIVEFFIVSRRFDIFEINQVLFKYDQPLLGI